MLVSRLGFFSPVLVYLEAAIWYYSSVWVPFWLLLWLLVVVSKHSCLRKHKSVAISNLISHTWVVLSSHALYMPTSSVVAFEIRVVLSLHNNTIICLKDVLHLLLRCHFYSAKCPFVILALYLCLHNKQSWSWNIGKYVFPLTKNYNPPSHTPPPKKKKKAVTLCSWWCVQVCPLFKSTKY